jgi:hypothetical protein
MAIRGVRVQQSKLGETPDNIKQRHQEGTLSTSLVIATVDEGLSKILSWRKRNESHELEVSE